jgi:hypothetical protein
MPVVVCHVCVLCCAVRFKLNFSHGTLMEEVKGHITNRRSLFDPIHLNTQCQSNIFVSVSMTTRDGSTSVAE